MPNFIPVSAGAQNVTKEQAIIWLAECVYPHQRPRSESWTQVLAGMMNRGVFRASTDIAFADFQGKRFLVNGNHTLHAVLRADAPQDLLIVRMVCTTMQEVNEIYMRYDAGRLRNYHNIYRAMELTQTLQMTRTQVGELGASVGFLAAGFSKRGIISEMLKDGTLKANMMAAWSPEAHLFYDALAGCPSEYKSLLATRSVMSLGLVTLRFQEEKARIFWEETSHPEEALDRNAPSSRLMRWLQQPKTYVKKIGVERHVRMVAEFWRAHSTAKRVSLKLLADVKGRNAIDLEGTLHDGAAVRVYLTLEGQILRESRCLEESSTAE